MALKVTGTATVKLLNGGTVNVSPDDLQFEIVGNEPRQMGDETHYSATHYFDDATWMTWDVWEYPSNALSHKFARGTRCAAVSDFHFHFED